MPADTVNVAIKKPIHARLRQLAKSEERDIKTVTNRVLSEALEKITASAQRQPATSAA